MKKKKVYVDIPRDVPRTIKQAAERYIEDGDVTAEWVSQEPKAAQILKHFLRVVQKEKDAPTLLIELARQYDAAVKDAGAEALRGIEAAASTLARMGRPEEMDEMVDGVIQACGEPSDVFAAKNDLFLVPRFRAACREALLDMGDRPAGDVTLEQIVRDAMRLLVSRALEKGRKGEAVDP